MALRLCLDRAQGCSNDGGSLFVIGVLDASSAKPNALLS